MSQDITQRVHEIAKEFSLTKQPPYITILQPRRSLKETPAQQLSSWQNRMIDVTSVAVSYHAIDGNPVDSARCYLIEKAIEDDPEYVLFVDEDTALPWNAVRDMIETSKQYPDTIVSGIYYVKFGNVMMSVLDERGRWVLPDVTPNSGVIRNVMSTGLGCALIPMRVIHKIREQFPQIPLFCIVPDKTWGDEDIVFIGEDTWFFNLARKCGIETVADTRVHCLHMELKTGKYAAHPDVNLSDFVTNMPPTERLTMEDRARVGKDYVDRICKPQSPQQIEWELEQMLEYAKGAKSVLEIGFAEGYTLKRLMEVADDEAAIVGVDLETEDVGGQDKTPDEVMQSWKKPNQTLHIIRDNSHKKSVKKKIQSIIPVFDFVFIDGDHSYEGVKQDYEDYKGKITALHDIHETNRNDIGVPKFWEELEGEEIIKDKNQNGFGIGIIK